VSEAIKSVASDVHAPHPVSSRRGELTSSAGMPELLLRGSGTGSVLGFGLDNLVEKGHGGLAANVKEVDFSRKLRSVQRQHL
jgi:hypothetical protein